MITAPVHAAFRNGDAREGCPQRQSVEARMIVLEPAPYPRTKPIPGTEDNLGPHANDKRPGTYRQVFSPLDNSILFSKGKGGEGGKQPALK